MARPVEQRRKVGGRRRAPVLLPAPLTASRRAELVYERAVKDTLLAPIDTIIASVKSGTPIATIRAQLRSSIGLTRNDAQIVDAAVSAQREAITNSAGRQWRGNMRGVLGERALGAGDARANARMAAWAQENRSLWRSVRAREHERLRLLAGNAKALSSRRRLLRTLNGERRIARNNVRRITVDQTQTAMGEQARIRQMAAGIDTFVWVTQRDERVRSSHMALDGTAHRWDFSPLPGQPINCRCRAAPNVRVDAQGRRA